VELKGLSFTPKKKKKRVYPDAYAEKQATARRRANEARQAVLGQERIRSMGDPVRGIRTPFIESFDTALEPQEGRKSDGGAEQDLLKHYFKPDTLKAALDNSALLTAPLANPDRSLSDPEAERRAEKQFQTDHAKAVEAVNRIVSLKIANSREKMRVNVQRCIRTFARHVVEQNVAEKPMSAAVAALKPEDRPPPRQRAGPDTGSSEVQIAILTAKIKVLADAYQGKNRNDKVNKRNLRLLLHRRQKLLQYLHKQDRGSGRWQHLISTLGLTEATWKGEINLL
jgi:ribosomal protein S15